MIINLQVVSAARSVVNVMTQGNNNLIKVDTTLITQIYIKLNNDSNKFTSL